MFTKVNSVYSAIGVMLFLIAMYLVLANPNGVGTLLKESSSGGVAFIRALQARDKV